MFIERKSTQQVMGPELVNCPTAISRKTNGIPMRNRNIKYGIKKAPFNYLNNFEVKLRCNYYI